MVETNKTKKVLHKVPFYSQLSHPEWRERGFKDMQHAQYWEKRSCGMACMKMVFDLHAEYKGQKFADLISEMEKKEVYKDGIGCLHQGIVDEFNNRNIDSQRIKINSLQEIKNLIDQENILIVSIGAGFIEGKKSGHLVPIIGYMKKNGTVTSVIVNHTSSLKERQWPKKEIEANKFMEHFSGNAVRVRLYNN